MVLSEGHKPVKSDRDPAEIATYPLALPMMATPIGIVILTTVSARFSDDTGTLALVAILLAVVMVINLVVLLTESVILKYISPDIINVAERILGLLLAALAVQTILNALQELGLIVIRTGGH